MLSWAQPLQPPQTVETRRMSPTSSPASARSPSPALDLELVEEQWEEMQRADELMRQNNSLRHENLHLRAILAALEAQKSPRPMYS